MSNQITGVFAGIGTVNLPNRDETLLVGGITGITEFDLPTTPARVGQTYTFKDLAGLGAGTGGPFAVTIVPTGGKTIDGQSVISLYPYMTLMIVYDGTMWTVVQGQSRTGANFVSGDHTIGQEESLTLIGAITADTTITLPAGTRPGETHTIKDWYGRAGQYNVTVTGGTSIEVNTDFQLPAFGCFTFVSAGGGFWQLIEGGPAARRVTVISTGTSFQMHRSDEVVEVSSVTGAFTLYLPISGSGYPDPIKGQQHTIKNMFDPGTHAVSLSGNGKLIDHSGVSPISMLQYESYQLTYDGTLWLITGHSA